jgi:hypothetical protein
MATSITTDATTTTLKNNGNTYLSVDTNDVVALTNPLPLASGGTGGTTSATAAAILAPIQLQTAVATTSGTSIDFTSIPANVKRINVMFNGVSTNGTSNPIIQLGVSGTPETSGYLGSSAVAIQGGTSGSVNNSSGFLVSSTSTAATVFYGSQAISIMDTATNTWSISGTLGQVGAANITTSLNGGIKPLAGELDMIRITTAGGANTFDAGSINISWEF